MNFWKKMDSFGKVIFWIITGHLLIIVMVAVMLTVSCKTLDTIKEQTASVRTELEDAVDSLGAELVAEIAAKVKAEIRRTREKLPDKIKAEIYRGARRLGIKTRGFTKQERQAASVYVAEMKKTPNFHAIANPPRAEDGKAYLKTPDGKWRPTEKEKEDYYRRNGRGKGVRYELELVLIALWKMNQDYLVYDGVRSCEKQKEYFKNGKSKINDCKIANHVRGWAADKVPLRGRQALWKDYQTMAYQNGLGKALFCTLKRQRPEWKGLRVRFGNDWDEDGKDIGKGFADPYHIEIRPGKDTCPNDVL